MNPTAVKQGQQGAKAAYAPAEQLISAQLPQVANLYTALVQGLQGQVGTQQGNVMTGAQRAGVAAPSMEGQVASLLSAALAPKVAQLGVTRSQATGNIQGQLGKAQTGRAMAATTLADQAQDSIIAAQENQMALQKMNRDAEVARIAEQTQRAQAAARSGALTQNQARGEFLTYIAQQMQKAGGQGNANISRQEQDAWANAWFSAMGVKSPEARQFYWDAYNTEYNRSDNPYEDWRYKR